MRLLGIDFGFERIGVAVGESEPAVATPRANLKASGGLKQDASCIAGAAIKEQAEAIVLGLPIEPSGEEGRMARICRTLAGHLADLGWVVHLVDERMTTVEAEAALRSTGAKAALRNRMRDGEAAARILERFMSEG